jgi:hypothetical protein
MDIEIDPKRAVVFGLGEIPEFGKVLSFLVEMLWPDPGQPDPWDLIKGRVEQLINQKLDEDAYGRVQASLKGIKDHFDDFKATLSSTTDPEHRFAAFDSLKGSFLDHAPEFQQPPYQLLLLPMFAQLANLHLSFLQDGYRHGKDQMNLEQAEVDQLRSDLKARVKSYSDYAMATLNAVRAGNFLGSDPRDEFNLSMTVNVVDYVTLWGYMDPDQLPPSGFPLPREVFSIWVGTFNPFSHQPSDPGYYPPPPSADRISRMQIWAGSAIDAIQVWYGSHPTPRMGGNGGLPAQPLDLTDAGKGEITQIDAAMFNGVQGLTLHLKGGSTAVAGSMDAYTKSFTVPDGHYVSSVNVISRYDDATRGWLYNDLVRTFYCGFKLKPEALAPPAALTS